MVTPMRSHASPTEGASPSKRAHGRRRPNGRRRRVFAAPLTLALLLCLPGTGRAATWTYQRTHEHDLDNSEYEDAGRMGCGLLANYGPSKTPHQIRVDIATSPFGPLTVYMGWERRLRIIVSKKRFASRPDEKTFVTIFAWVRAQIPKSPPPCQFYLAEPETAVIDLQFPGPSKLVDDVTYVAVQLEMAGKAMSMGDTNLAGDFRSGAYGMFSSAELDRKERRQLRRDPRMREAAYGFVTTPAPEGITEIVRHGYCRMYEMTAQLFPPRSKKERQLFRERTKSLRCQGR